MAIRGPLKNCKNGNAKKKIVKIWNHAKSTIIRTLGPHPSLSPMVGILGCSILYYRFRQILFSNKQEF